MSYTKQYAVSEYMFKQWGRKLEVALFESQFDTTDRRYIAINNVIHDMKAAHLAFDPVRTEHKHGATKGELIDEMAPKFAYDTALPQAFLDDVMKVTGEYIPQHLIWNVDDNRPVALTSHGQLVLKIYKHITGLY